MKTIYTFIITLLVVFLPMTVMADDNFKGKTDLGHEFTFKTNSDYHAKFIYSPREILEVSKVSFDNYNLFGKEINKVTYFIDGKKVLSTKKPPYYLYYDLFKNKISLGTHQLKIKIEYTHDFTMKYKTEFVFPLEITNNKPPRPEDLDDRSYTTVRKGYTHEKCLEAWGEPESKKTEDRMITEDGNTEHIIYETWYYKFGRELHFKNGILDFFKETY